MREKLSAVRNSGVASFAAEENLRIAHDSIAHLVERARDERPRCFDMTAAAEATRELVHVYVAGAAKGDLHLTVAEVAEEDCHARAGNRSGMLDDSIQVLGSDTVPLERSGAHRQPGYAAPLIDAKTGQDLGEQ